MSSSSGDHSSMFMHFTPNSNKPRPFPVVGAAPGARCGHTLTAIAGHDGDYTGAKLVMFGMLRLCIHGMMLMV